MALTKFEREILAELKTVTGNKNLKERDMLEWRMGDLDPQEGEVVVALPKCGVKVAIPKPEDA